MGDTPDKKNKRRFFTLKNKRHMPTWLAGLLAFIFKLVSLTYRLKVVDTGGWYEQRQPWPAVVSLWHNRILFITSLVKRNLLERMFVLISASRDGEYISTFVRFFGLRSVRGSSSRGGLHALLELNHIIKGGDSVVLTVDGPRGPKYRMSPGPIRMASETGIRIVPMAVNYSSYWELKSWDNFQIPKPWAKITLHLGPTFTVPPNLSKDELNQWCLEAERRLNALTIDK